MHGEFIYEILIINDRSRWYRKEEVSASSFCSALFRAFQKNKELIDSVCSIYCKKPISGDLKLMGRYYGTISTISGYKCTLDLTNGESYYMAEDGFRRLVG